MKRCFSFLLVWLLLLASCQKQLPQLPANKNNAIDSVGAGLLKINEALILSEDSMLTDFISKSDSDFTKHKQGFWYKMNLRTNSETLKTDSKCTIDYSVYLLNNKFCKTQTNTIIIGKNQIAAGVEELLRQMHKGEKATLVLPWYLAWGMKGDGDLIPPYTSVVIYLHLRN